MEYKHAKIQVLDVPGIVQGAAAGTGRGKEVLQVIRNANLVLILVDVFHPEHYEVILREVHNTGVRLNQKSPDVRIKKTMRGGLQIGKTVPLPELTDAMIRSIMKEFKLVNANVLIREPINADQLIDVIQKNCVYTNAVTILNKIDMIDEKELEKVKRKVKPDLCISAHKKLNIPELKEVIFNGLEFMRVYCKDPGKPPDMDVPVIIRRGSTISDFANQLHRDFSSKFRFARVWGDSAKFPGQKQSLKHVLVDKDIVELHIA
jgi:ribosome-interacting GTPase 1